MQRKQLDHLSCFCQSLKFHISLLDFFKIFLICFASFKAAFNCIRSLWNRKPLKVYGGRMAESMLAILCHILRGEPVIQERLAKEREGTTRSEDEGTSTGSLVPTAVPGGSSTTAEAPAASGTTGAPSGGPAEESTNSTPRHEPQVNQVQLTQVLTFDLVTQPI